MYSRLFRDGTAGGFNAGKSTEAWNGHGERTTRRRRSLVPNREEWHGNGDGGEKNEKAGIKIQ